MAAQLSEICFKAMDLGRGKTGDKKAGCVRENEKSQQSSVASDER